MKLLISPKKMSDCFMSGNGNKNVKYECWYKKNRGKGNKIEY